LPKIFSVVGGGRVKGYLPFLCPLVGFFFFVVVVVGFGGFWFSKRLGVSFFSLADVAPLAHAPTLFLSSPYFLLLSLTSIAFFSFLCLSVCLVCVFLCVSVEQPNKNTHHFY